MAEPEFGENWEKNSSENKRRGIERTHSMANSDEAVYTSAGG